MNSQSLKVKTQVLLIYGAPFVVGALVFVLCLRLEQLCIADVAEFYQKNMRASLFAGFLTLGSFLLSLKTGIVIKIKENVYDKPSYQEKVDKAQAAGIQTTVYAPLRRLSKLLSAAVLSALFASTLQLTLGLFSMWWAAATCLSMAAIALMFLLEAFGLIQKNLWDWFEFLDDEAISASSDRKAAKEKENRAKVS